MQQTEWGPKIGAIAGLGIAGILMAIGCVTVVTDPPGRILTGIAAVGLLAFAFGSWRARPKLAITGDGLVYRGWFRSQMLRRPDIALIRITEFRRIGRKTRLLEIETAADRLIVLSRWDLGADPLGVLDALTDAGYAGR
ncbi:PH domain-containing protein [Mycolicibacterium sphagni]|uniref:PH domain-containing protein n=1 Tax=Mycolicibacterium sphagni TaxID=1786 RepID=A0ABX2K0N2_9MYCO|nr:PH domain-containing protein [Mycolicibacterium sphagni]NTY61634.1 PH domain-containing protein [Mycolicibacterium sphagni]